MKSLGSRGVSLAYKLGKRVSGLGKPISEADHYIVRVFYGGYYCEETLEGPYATIEEAAAVVRERWDAGTGAVVYRCSNVTRDVLPPRQAVQQGIHYTGNTDILEMQLDDYSKRNPT